MTTLINITGLDDSAGGLQFTVNRGFRIPASLPATYTTTFGTANSNLTFVAKAAGTAGNAVTITYAVAGANTPLSIGVVGNAITVNVATNGSSVATSTAAQVRDAIRASGPASALVAVDTAPGNDGTGVVSALSSHNLAGGANQGTGTNVENGNRMVTAGNIYQVDLDNDIVRKRLHRFLRTTPRWVSLPGGSLLQTVRSLDTTSSADVGQSYISRGFRIPGSILGYVGSDTNQNLTTASGGVKVDLTKPTVRRALRQHWGRWAVGNQTNSLVTIRALVTSSSAPGGGLSAGRGFRVPHYGQTGGSGSSNEGYINSTTNVQVDLSDPNVRRALRRNLGNWVVVSSP